MHELSDFSDSQFLEKMQKLICKLPKCFANCELRTANSNPLYVVMISRVQCMRKWIAAFNLFKGLKIAKGY